MTHDEKLTELRMELARQDASLDQARQQIEALTDHPIEVPEAWLREVEDACVPRVTSVAIVIGIRA